MKPWKRMPSKLWRMRWKTYFRSSSDWESHGTGDRLLIQTGTTDNLVSIPLTQAEADMTSDWWDKRRRHLNYFKGTDRPKWIWSKCHSSWFSSGMITSVSLVWEITTSNSIILLTRFSLMSNDKSRHYLFVTFLVKFIGALTKFSLRLATLCCPSRSSMIRELLLDLSGRLFQNYNDCHYNCLYLYCIVLYCITVFLLFIFLHGEQWPYQKFVRKFETISNDKIIFHDDY